MKLTILGTGNALVTECYNTCFVIEDDGKYFMVDGGGGSGILSQLKKAGLDYTDIKDIFVTHKHIDHILGIIWIIRVITTAMGKGTFVGDARIYGHDEVISLIDELAHKLLQTKESAFIGDRLHLITVEDGQSTDIIGHKVTFFDIGSTKAKQFGFSMMLNENEKLTCCGDEPYCDREEKYAKDSKWLLHEAFCLYSQAEVFKPYEKHHSTAKDACELAASLGVENIVLYHTEDKNISNRRELYLAEGQQYFSGKIFVPNDLDVIEL